MKHQQFFSFLFVLFALTTCSQNNSTTIDSLEFQKGYPNKNSTALEQLTRYPSPRYKRNNNFYRLFNWMNMAYLGGSGQFGVTEAQAFDNLILLQKELALNWNYCFVMRAHLKMTDQIISNPRLPYKRLIDLVNEYPKIPLGVITFWGQINSKQLGFGNNPINIYRKDFPDKLYIKNKDGKVVKRMLNFAAPDSLFIQDGQKQKLLIASLVRYLKRPINIINENGEEPPGVLSENNISEDVDMIADKARLKIDSWKVYKSEKKKHFRKLYSSQFIDGLTECKKTAFTVYCVEGGPIDRFDWQSSKATCSQIKGNYYSTPDFYPRWANNWKNWSGAWHGWKWINDGRKVEISNGDKFFSPFIAAGWSYNPESDMRPAQWLGLLKCLSVVGAEFYYTAYFNLKKPETKPQDYVWQAAIPAYAQAISTYYSDVFFNGNVLFDDKKEPIVTYPVDDKDVLVVVRKHSSLDKYVIAATVQPTTISGHAPFSKKIEIKVAGETIKLMARRQGSVYVYDKSVSPSICYQLDNWHQYEHPDRWRKEWLNDAEVIDSSNVLINHLIHSNFNKTNQTIDITNLESYITLSMNDWTSYFITSRDISKFGKAVNVWLRVKSTSNAIIKTELNKMSKDISIEGTKEWKWVNLSFLFTSAANNDSFLKLTCLKNSISIDKILITDELQLKDFSKYSN